MKRYFFILFSIILISLTSCKKDESISFGTVEYYPSFLWVDSKTKPVTKTLDFDFSQDAKNDNSYAVLQFVDNEGKSISTEVMQVIIDDKEISNNQFRINSDVTSKELIFKFSTNAEEGKHQGYLRLINHSLDRLDSQPLTPNQQVDVFQWTLNYDKCMNPLLNVLLWIGGILLTLLLLWIFLIRKIVYDYIKVGSIRITEPYFSQRRIKGARQVVFINKKTKQGRLNRLFTGKIIYEINPVWTTPVVFEAASKGEVKMKSNEKYTINPFDFKLRKQEEYTLINEDTKDEIKLTIY